MRALVTGGGGFLGRAITEMLLTRGDEVSVLSRGRYPEVEALGATGIALDLAAPELDAAALRDALAGVDTVFHVAARAGVWGKREEFWAINVEGTKRLLEAAKRAGARRFVYTSSPSAVWSGGDEAGLSEADCPYPTSYLGFYPESKAAAERQVLASHSEEMATTALRPHLIWGARDPHLVPRLLERGRAGKLRIVGKGTNKVGITAVENAAHAHLLAADALGPRSRNAGKAYFITDDQPVELWRWINDLFAAMGIPPVTAKVPVGVAYAAGAAAEQAWRLTGRAGEPPMTRFVARQLATDHYYDLAAARRDFGYHQHTDPAAAWGRMIAWLKEQR